MAIAIDLSTKADATIVDGLSFAATTTAIGLLCQLNTPLNVGEYVELLCTSMDSQTRIGLGELSSSTSFTQTGTLWYTSTDGKIYPGGTLYGATFTTNDVIGISLSSEGVAFYKNGVSQGYLTTPQHLYPSVHQGITAAVLRSGVFRVTYETIQYLPSGYVPIGTTAVNFGMPIAVILSTFPATLTRGFR
jgi:hypothetical protein